MVCLFLELRLRQDKLGSTILIAGSMLPRCNFAVTFLFLRWKRRLAKKQRKIAEAQRTSNGRKSNFQRRKSGAMTELRLADIMISH